MSSTKQNNPPRQSVFFAAIDQYVETYIVEPTEKEYSNREWVEWGTKNAYPDYILELYKNVPTLQSIINGNIDYIAGDDIAILPLQPEYENGEMNRKGDTIREQIKDISFDYEKLGGFALQVIRGMGGDPVEVYYIDMGYLRANKECDVFYYCEKWGNRKADIVEYPAFVPNLDWGSLTDEQRARHASSILYVKNTHSQVYPAPLFAAAVKACEIERLIDDFHISDLNNHFTSSAIVNFNNGDPGDEMKKEIVNEANEKFSGTRNAGRIMYSWNPNKDSATTIVEFEVKDFGERYKALSQHSRQQIFTAFRAIPLLFGLTSEANTGFSTDEFEQSFKLYNRTQIQPVQKMICDAYDKIYGKRGVLTIKPFSLGGDTEDNVN